VRKPEKSSAQGRNGRGLSTAETPGSTEGNERVREWIRYTTETLLTLLTSVILMVCAHLRLHFWTRDWNGYSEFWMGLAR
jgi:hypothetical protein